MNIGKAQIKKAIYHSLGCTADDWLEGSRGKKNQHAGAKKALAGLAKNLASLASFVDKDMDEGALDEHGELSLKVAEYAKKYIQRCVDAAINTARYEENCEIAANGTITAHEQMVKHLQKMHEGEESRIKGFEEALKDGEIEMTPEGEAQATMSTGRPRPVGARPAPSIAAQRKAEDAEEGKEEKPKKKARRTRKKSVKKDAANSR